MMLKGITEIFSESPFVVAVAAIFSLLWGWLVAVPGVVFPDEYPLPIPAEVLPPLIPDDNPRSDSERGAGGGKTLTITSTRHRQVSAGRYDGENR